MIIIVCNTLLLSLQESRPARPFVSGRHSVHTFMLLISTLFILIMIATRSSEDVIESPLTREPTPWRPQSRGGWRWGVCHQCQASSPVHMRGMRV